ncbi:MAG: ATP-binding protein, partial [Planctomycetota bacterium]
RVGRLTPEVEEVDANTMVASIAELTDNPNGVEFRYPEDLPRFTTLRTPLEQVLMNLISNAIKYNDRGQQGLVELDWRNGGEFYHVSVRDNGPGIPEKDHDRVFQMYQRVGDPDIEGSGMGLAVVKKQIEQVGGEVRIESSVGEGARFDFTWPVRIENNAVAS